MSKKLFICVKCKRSVLVPPDTCAYCGAVIDPLARAERARKRQQALLRKEESAFVMGIFDGIFEAYKKMYGGRT